MLHRKTIDVRRFKEICMDFTQLHFSSTVNLNAWVSRDRRRTIEEENRRDDLVRRPEVEWQNFDIALSVPEPTYTEEQCWFKIYDYSTSDPDAWATPETFFCEHCEQEKDASIFCRDNRSFKSDRPQFPDRCVGCTYKHALRNSYFQINEYKDLRNSESYSLACARYLYIQFFQDTKPGDNLLEYIKKCCPIAYCLHVRGKSGVIIRQLPMPHRDQHRVFVVGKGKATGMGQKPPSRDEAVERDVEEIIAALTMKNETNYDSSYGVDTSTLPQEDVHMGHEEPEGDATVGENDALRIARAKAWDATRLLVHGSFDVNADNPQNLCVLCGSSEHGLGACDSNSELKRVLCEAFEAMTNAISSFPEVLSLPREITDRRPDREGQASAASMDVDIESIASSSTRRPKAKAMPRRGAHGAHAGIRIVEYDSPQVLGYAINRRRGEHDACGEGTAKFSWTMACMALLHQELRLLISHHPEALQVHLQVDPLHPLLVSLWRWQHLPLR
ncbi:unnamed protein product [Symbiodinium sp. CCMP2456]|nr:unnamed protein product [Symbiodinium sp. CCMP2456]